MGEIVTKFDDFVNNIYDSVKESLSIERMEEDLNTQGNVKTRVKDDDLKIKTDNQKIKINVAQPTDPNELARYEFKVVTKGMDDATSKKEALDYLANFVTDQMNKGFIKPGMVAFINTSKARKRVFGDYVVAGALSVYNANALPNLAQVQPIYTLPFSGAQSANSKATTENVAGSVIEASPAQTVLKVYNYEDMSKAKMQAPTIDTKTATTVTQQGVAEPEPSVEEQPDQLSYEGLTKNNQVNPIVKDLQARIIIKGKADAAAEEEANLILNSGGADGIYGNATANAIGLLTGQEPVTTIDNRTSNALVKYLGTVPQEQVDSLLTQATPVQVEQPSKEQKPEQPSDDQTPKIVTQADQQSEEPSQNQQTSQPYVVDTNNQQVPKLYF